MKIIGGLGKATMIVCVAVLALGAVPLTSAVAAPAQDPSTPPAEGEISAERLEHVWARQQRAYNRQGRMLERSAGLIEKAQGLLDRAQANGKDVSAAQAALDAFADAVDEAQAVYDSAGVIVDSHSGFDEAGKVTDMAQAQETVQSLAAKLEEIRGSLGKSGRALHEALKDFREANRPAERPSEPNH